MNQMSRQSRKALLLLVSITILIAVVFVLLVDPIAQDDAYHNFFDRRTLLGIANFYNVITNLPYAFVGLWGIYLLAKNQLQIINEIKLLYYIFFVGVFFVCFGSGYYHYTPNSETLFWDRLPMTLGFMSLFSIIIAEFISLRTAKIIIIPLLLFGVFSVYYWLITEQAGAGDLRYYAIVQFLPMLLIPFILYYYRSIYNSIKGYWYLLLCYVLAKVFEHFDIGIGELFILSGHPIKHVISAVGVYFLIRNYQTRQLLRTI